jgi:hypothetical protein
MSPVFNHGHTEALCAPSIAHDAEGDWEYFYVNWWVLFCTDLHDYPDSYASFVDRDMLMRFLGVGVGQIDITLPGGRESPNQETYTARNLASEGSDGEGGSASDLESDIVRHQT